MYGIDSNRSIYSARPKNRCLEFRWAKLVLRALSVSAGEDTAQVTIMAHQRRESRRPFTLNRSGVLHLFHRRRHHMVILPSAFHLAASLWSGELW